jgi:hypothetical protein
MSSLDIPNGNTVTPLADTKRKSIFSRLGSPKTQMGVKGTPSPSKQCKISKSMLKRLGKKVAPKKTTTNIIQKILINKRYWTEGKRPNPNFTFIVNMTTGRLLTASPGKIMKGWKKLQKNHNPNFVGDRVLVEVVATLTSTSLPDYVLNPSRVAFKYEGKLGKAVEAAVIPCLECNMCGGDMVQMSTDEAWRDAECTNCGNVVEVKAVR